MISTDDHNIQEEARRHKVEVPFTRPAHLASDDARTDDVVSHAVDFVEAQGDHYDALMLLEPSTPFATSVDYDGAVRLMMERNADVVLGMRRVSPHSLFVGQMAEDDCINSIVRRVHGWQTAGYPSLPQEYTMNGALYLVRWGFFKKHRRIYAEGEMTYGYAMDPHYSIEIDHPIELHLAEFMLESGHVNFAHWH